METKKILAIIFSLVFVAIFGFVLSWGIINFNKVKEGMSGTELYTSEDLKNSYQDGYDTALSNKAEYEELINGYRDTITTLNDSISSLNSQITSLKSNNQDAQNQIASLNRTIASNEETIAGLERAIASNDSVVSDLEDEIATHTNTIQKLRNEIALLEESGELKSAEIESKKAQITSLNNQVGSLQTMVNQLNATNALNVSTIKTLNSQIQDLNSQISELRLEINTNDPDVSALNDKIAELEKSVEYYEQYVSTLETENQVVATFEFDNSVYNIQVLNKGGFASVVEPTSTDYIVFNGWTVDGVNTINLSTYAINKNTKFVANVTYKHAVNFYSDNTLYKEQIVVKGQFATKPTNPVKDGYSFEGWSIDGVNIIDLSTYEITKDTDLIAVYTKLFTVKFMYEDTVYNTQTIKNGMFANNVNVDSTDTKIFNGWLVNGTAVDISTYKIVADTVFVADLTYYYNVEFKQDGTLLSSQLVIENGYIIIPDEPVKEGYTFIGWSVDGYNTVALDSIVVNDNMVFSALYIEDNYYSLMDYNSSYIKKYNEGKYFVSKTSSPTALYDVDHTTQTATVLSSDEYAQYFFTTKHGDVIVGGTKNMYFYRSDLDTTSQIPTNNSNIYPFRHFLELEDGSVIITSNSSSQGTYFYNSTTRQIEKISETGVGEYNVSKEIDGKYLLASRINAGGIFAYDVATKTITSVYDAADYYYTLMLSNGDVILSKSNYTSGIWLYDHLTGEITLIYEDGYYWSKFIELPDGTVLLSPNQTSSTWNTSGSSTTYGVLKYDKTTKTMTQIYSSYVNWLDKVVMLDNGGCLMMGGSTSSLNMPNGVLYYNPTTQKISRIVSGCTAYLTKVLSSGQVVINALKSSGPCLAVFDPATASTKQITTYSSSYGWCDISEFSDGTVLISMDYWQQAYIWSQSSKTYTSVYYDTNTNLKLEIGDGTAIIGTNDVYMLYDIAEKKATRILQDCTMKYITFNYIGNGKLLLSSTSSYSGLIIYDINEKTFEYITEVGRGYEYCKVINNNKVLIASSHNSTQGLFCYDMETGEFTQLLNRGYGWDTFEETDNGIVLSSSKPCPAPRLLYSYDLGKIVL